MRFKTALQALCDEQVEFVVIGGVSALWHGSARATLLLLEIFYSLVPANLERVVAALAPFHPRPRDFPAGLPFIWDDAMLRNSSALTLQTDLGEIDLFAEVAGPGGWNEVNERAITVSAFDRSIRTLDLASLIASKRAAGRPKDHAALPELESILESEKQ
jgi:hypothetical protein